MYLTFLLLRYIIDRHLEYVRMGGICSGIEVAITRTIRNRLTVDPVRGFESHPLRHDKLTGYTKGVVCQLLYIIT